MSSQSSWQIGTETLGAYLVAPRLAFGVDADAANPASMVVRDQVIPAQFMSALAMRLSALLGISLLSFLWRPSEDLFDRGHNLLRGSTAFNPLPDGRLSKRNHANQIGCKGLPAINIDGVVSSRVAHLLSAGRPPNVAWLIWSVVVNAIQRFAFRSLPHIGHERPKVSPFVAHGDAAPAIVRVIVGLRAIATAQHHLPSRIKGMIDLLHPLDLSVGVK